MDTLILGMTMRKPTYLSPTSIKMFYEDRGAFYVQYLMENRIPRPPQTEPMAVGSAFDAYIKSYLVERLVGKSPEFERDKIFEMQVEAQNRDFAKKAGQHLFEVYKSQGALADILLDLEGAVGAPRFETAVEGFVGSVSVALGDVPLLGKPDIFFISKSGARVIFDWKVNGYCSRAKVSPKPGYIRIRPDGKQHPKAMVMKDMGMSLAISHPLDTVESDWAAQLSIYAWLLGNDVGSRFVVAIDQLCCGAGNADVRIAQHRSVVNEKFQQDLFRKAHTAWYAIQAEHPWFELSKTESDAMCRTIDTRITMPPSESFEDLIR